MPKVFDEAQCHGSTLYSVLVDNVCQCEYHIHEWGQLLQVNPKPFMGEKMTLESYLFTPATRIKIEHAGAHKLLLKSDWVWVGEMNGGVSEHNVCITETMERQIRRSALSGKWGVVCKIKNDTAAIGGK